MKNGFFLACLYAGCRVVGFALVLTALSGTAMAQRIPRAPEIDAGSVATALALLAGGMTMMLGRRRKK